MKRLRTAFTMSWAERRLYLWSWVLLWHIRLMLWLLPYRVWKRITTGMIYVSNPQSLDKAALDQVTGAVKLTCRYVPSATCLT